ncbi:MAG: glutamate-5-semialdehyde dehydrogenase [Spirochaetaceae bacterium]|jgi:glutamate-5-semialdehyde dehydrogenase|nr:glutamate-5-semialdehyde dehydrogenase [Spirochaetaceae bacterium]
MSLEPVFINLKAAKATLALESGQKKDEALRSAANSIRKNTQNILAANKIDVDQAEKKGLKAALVDRLLLTHERIELMALGIEDIARLENPIGKVLCGWTRPNGLFIEKITVPLGVVAIIYESRPNVTADAFALAYKSGCPILLRGSSSALNSNKAIVKAIVEGLQEKSGIQGAIALADSGDHCEIDEILQARAYIDVVLPRGGHDLIRKVVEDAHVPVIQTGEGNCHIYVEKGADPADAVEIIYNAKTQKPGACNAIETLLVQNAALTDIMPALAKKMAGKCELRCDELSFNAIGAVPDKLLLKKACKEDWETEFLDYILAVKTVENLDEAVKHINQYGTGHSEAILTPNLVSAQRFMEEIDAACVYVNASTRFTDGGEFGFGAELGISTQKFHARGPMGLEALTTVKYRITGHGQVRQ